MQEQEMIGKGILANLGNQEIQPTVNGQEGERCYLLLH